MTDRELMQQALDALEDRVSLMKWQAARDALRERLAQPEQEPVAWMGVHDKTDLYYRKPPQADVVPLYTAPQRREWVGLTEEECIDAIDEYFDFALGHGNVSNASVIRYARAIETKLKEKNA